MKNLTRLMVIVLFALTAYSLQLTAAFASIPKTMNFQAKLTDKAGTPLNGTYQIKLAIYDALTNGNKLWEEAQSAIVSEGIANLILGSVTALNLAFDKQYWLEIAINNELLPQRQQLSSSAYALNAERLAGIAVNNFLYADANDKVWFGTAKDANLYRHASNILKTDGQLQAGSLGVGYKALTPLTVAGRMSINEGNRFWSLGAGRADGTGNGVENDNATIAPGTFAIRDTWAQRDIVRIKNGNVGIGTLSPAYKLDVKSPANAFAAWIQNTATSGVRNGLSVLGGSSSSDYSLVVNNAANTANHLIVKGDGKTGIGTAYPQEKLHVAGKVKAQAFITGDIVFTNKVTGQPLWNMYEDEKGLYLKSAITGKAYKFVLEEIK